MAWHVQKNWAHVFLFLFNESSCGIDIHASPFQGDFDRVTIDQLILLFTSLLLSFRQIRKWKRSEFRWNNHYSYLLLLNSADWDVVVCRFWCGTCWIDRFERLGARARIHAASCGIYYPSQRCCCLIITILIAGIEHLAPRSMNALSWFCKRPISCFFQWSIFQYNYNWRFF